MTAGSFTACYLWLFGEAIRDKIRTAIVNNWIMCCELYFIMFIDTVQLWGMQGKKGHCPVSDRWQNIMSQSVKV